MNELRELTDSEIDAVAGGLNTIGFSAQAFGGQAVAGQINYWRTTLGGEATGDLVAQTAQQTVPGSTGP